MCLLNYESRRLLTKRTFPNSTIDALLIKYKLENTICHLMFKSSVLVQCILVMCHILAKFTKILLQ